MPFTVEINGRDVEFQNKPTETDIDEAAKQMGSAPQRTKATEKDFLSTKERFKGGFRRDEDLQRVRAEQRQERGLAPGTPLEPVGFNIRNLMDLPSDIADIVGPAFPIIGATIGGVGAGAAALPTGPGAIAAVAGGGAAGGATGQFARQRIGAQFGFDQGKVVEQLGEIAKEGAFGAIQEVGGVFLGKALNATKRGILKAANNLIKNRGAEGFIKHFGSIASHMDVSKTEFALNAVKNGDMRVLSPTLSDKNFADKFARQLFFGEDGNLAKQIFRLSHRKGGKEAIRDLYKQFFPKITDDVFETIFKKGNSVNSFNKPNVIRNLGRKINSGLDDLFNKTGKELERARLKLSESGKLIDVGDDLSAINTALSKKLTGIEFLVKEGEDVFSINPSFAGTNTGSAQAKMFGQLVSRFFKTEGDDVLVKAAQRGDVEALQKLANKVTTGRRTLFGIKNKVKFGDFINQLKQIDVQISGSEFKALGKLSPELTEYLRGLRSIPLAVESKLGGSEVLNLTKAFEEFADGASLLRQGNKVGNAGQIEKALQRFVKAQPGTTNFQQVGELNKFLQQNLGVDFIDDLRSFKAAQVLKEINTGFGDLKARESVVSLMKNAFNEDAEKSLVNILKERFDPFLPKDLKIGELSEIHTVANALHRDAASLLRGRFLTNALLPATGATIGGILQGPQGAAAGIGLGLALQNKGILRALIKASAKLSSREVNQLAIRGVGKGTQQAARNIPAGTRVLSELLNQNRN